jgi:hypothetical protein
MKALIIISNLWGDSDTIDIAYELSEKGYNVICDDTFCGHYKSDFYQACADQESNRGCIDCINCKNCKDCKNCENCTDCENCEYSKNRANCENLDDCDL